MALKVLLIDDSMLQRNLVGDLVTKLGYVTLKAKDGAEGLELARIHEPDCILCDLVMPNLDGFQFLQQISTILPDCPVVILTADIQTTTQDKCLQLGAEGFVNKPVTLDKIETVLTKLIKPEPSKAAAS